MAADVRVEVIIAWRRGFVARTLDLPEGATVEEAVAASGLPTSAITGYAVHGERVAQTRVLQEHDRVELLRSLLVDPKEARRRRALKSDR